MDFLRDRLELNDYSHQLQHVRELLPARNDLNQQDANGHTPLYRAIAANLADNVEVIKEYIKSKADVNLSRDLADTPLHCAVKYHKALVVEALISAGASVNAKGFGGRTALHLAVIPWKVRVRRREYNIHFTEEIAFKLLTHEDIDRNAVDSNGETPLMLAVRYKQHFAVKMLSRFHPNPNICNHLLETPLHVAFEVYSMFAEPILVLMGADICCVDQNGKTPFDIFDQNPVYSSQSMWTKCILRVIAFHYNITDILIEKLNYQPDLKELLRGYSEEVLQLRTDFITPKLTVHDFILNSFNENQFTNPDLQIYQPIVERLVRDDYPEYFCSILENIPLENLIISVRIAALGNVEGNLNPSLDFFSRGDSVELISKYLDHFNIFCLIAAFTNVKIPESMINLRKRALSVMYYLR